MNKNRKYVGNRKLPKISIISSGELLRRGCEVNDALHSLPTGETTYFPKGVYRYKTFEQANQHWISCLIKGMVQIKK